LQAEAAKTERHTISITATMAGFLPQVRWRAERTAMSSASPPRLRTRRLGRLF
jgi:hypothetical protein